MLSTAGVPGKTRGAELSNYFRWRWDRQIQQTKHDSWSWARGRSNNHFPPRRQVHADILRALQMLLRYHKSIDTGIERGIEIMVSKLILIPVPQEKYRSRCDDCPVVEEGLFAAAQLQEVFHVSYLHSPEYFANSFCDEADFKYLFFSPATVIGQELFVHASFNSEPRYQLRIDCLLSQWKTTIGPAFSRRCQAPSGPMANDALPVGDVGRTTVDLGAGVFVSRHDVGKAILLPPYLFHPTSPEKFPRSSHPGATAVGPAVTRAPLVPTILDTSWRRLAQSSPAIVAADNQCAVDVGLSLHKTVESRVQRSGCERSQAGVSWLQHSTLYPPSSTSSAALPQYHALHEHAPHRSRGQNNCARSKLIRPRTVLFFVSTSSPTYVRLHHRGSKLDPRSDLRSTQKTVAPFEFRAGLEIEMKFISNRRNWRSEISIRDQQLSSTNRLRLEWSYSARARFFRILWKELRLLAMEEVIVQGKKRRQSERVSMSRGVAEIAPLELAKLNVANLFHCATSKKGMNVRSEPRADMFRNFVLHLFMGGGGRGGSVAERLDSSPPHQGEPGSILRRFTPEYHKWESCRMTPLVGRFSQGSPVSPALAFRRSQLSSPSPAFMTTISLVTELRNVQYRPEITYMCVMYTFVYTVFGWNKSRPNIFTRSSIHIRIGAEKLCEFSPVYDRLRNPVHTIPSGVRSLAAALVRSQFYDRRGSVGSGACLQASLLLVQSRLHRGYAPIARGTQIYLRVSPEGQHGMRRREIKVVSPRKCQRHFDSRHEMSRPSIAVTKLCAYLIRSLSEFSLREEIDDLLAFHKDEPGSIPGRATLSDFRTWKLCWTMPLISGFSRSFLFPSALAFRHRSILITITLIGSQDLAVKSRPELFTHSLTYMRGRGKLEIPEKTRRTSGIVRGDFRTRISVSDPTGNRTRSALMGGNLLASHQDEHGSIPGLVTEFSHVGIVPYYAVGQWVFSGVSRFPRPFIPVLLHTSVTLIGSRDPTVKSRSKPPVLEVRGIKTQRGEKVFGEYVPGTLGTITQSSLLFSAGGSRGGETKRVVRSGGSALAQPAEVIGVGHVIEVPLMTAQQRGRRRRREKRFPRAHTDKIDVKHVYTEVDIAIGSQFIRHDLDDSEPIADLQGNNLLASQQGEPGSITGRVTPGFSHVGIVPGDAVGWRVFSGISHFPRPFIPAPLHIHFNHSHRL
ncbi:hypothetical protein PR048_025760 [Dryococelus australis]|uniref:Uncharacterized protein n=1 Tax=Dryococelus australis TaxID=614101 RepID=A0ABQ9GJE9_9NEOP|nr:hypothetical protein PR048_025760 [Dryococelus australis]